MQEQIKSGVSSTEFWTTIVTGIIAAADKRWNLGIDPTLMAGILVSNGIYVLGRSHVKAQAVRGIQTVAMGDLHSGAASPK